MPVQMSYIYMVSLFLSQDHIYGFKGFSHDVAFVENENFSLLKSIDQT